jgi:mannose-6-phosphate isomerase
MNSETEFQCKTGLLTEKPWGYEKILEHNPSYTIKELNIADGKRLSLQYHEQKIETVFVLSGKLFNWSSENEDSYEIHYEGSVIHVPPGKVHRFGALLGDCRLLECSTSMLNDVVRLSDDYNRE